MSDKIYLETDEEITAAIDKIASAKSSTVYVLVPRRSSIIQSIVNLKLLKRQADTLKKKIVLVTTDTGGRSLAKKAGLATKIRLSRSADKDDVEEPEVSEEAVDDETDDFSLAEKMSANDSGEADLSQEIELNDVPGFRRRIKKTTKKKTDKGASSKQSALARILAATKKEKQTTSDKTSSGQSKNKSRLFSKKTSARGSGKVFLLPSLSIKSFFLFFTTSILVLGVVFFLVLPKADILVVPKTEPFSTSFDVVISQNISEVDTDKLTMPGKLTSAEASSEQKKFSATGEKETGDKARGQVTLYNNYSSESQFLPASSQLVTNGLVYLLLQDVTVSGAKVEGGDTIPGQAKALVEASVPGEDYNIGAARFVITSLSQNKQADIYGKSLTQFTGGSSKKVKVISEEDLDKARTALLAEASSEAMKKLTDEVGNGKILREELLNKEILEVESSVEADSEGEEFEMKVMAKVSGFVFSADDLSQLLSAKFDQLMPTEKYVIDQGVQEGLAFEKIDQEFGQEEALTAKLSVNKVVAWRLNEQKIKRDIRNKDQAAAEEYLKQNPNIINVEISLWPFWVKKVPKTERKIEIQLDKDKIADNI